MWKYIDKYLNGAKSTILGGLCCYAAWWEQGMEESDKMLVYGGYLLGILLILAPKQAEKFISDLISKVIGKKSG